MKANRLAIILTVIGFGLRLYQLDFQPLWGDEGWSFYFATMPVATMLVETARDIHPPFYYLLLHLWLIVAGGGPIMARFLSVISGTLLIPLGFCFGQLLTGYLPKRPRPAVPPGLAVAGVMAFAPLAVYYSQEVRMYGLAALLGLSSTYFYLQLLAGKRGAFWPYVITAALVLYTHYYSAFVVIVHGGYWLLGYKKMASTRRRMIFAALAAVGLLYLPWLIFAGGELAHYVENKTAVEGYTPLALHRFLGDYLSAFSLGHLPENLQPYRWLALAFAGLAGRGWWLVWQSRRQAVDSALLLGLYLLLPLLLGWLVNLVNPFTPQYFERTLLIAGPAWWVLIGLGLLRLGRKQFAWLIVALLAIKGGLLVYFYQTPRYTEADYRPLLAKIAAIADPDDVVLASFEWQLGLYRAYLPEPRPRLYAVPEWGARWGDDAAQMQADMFTLLADDVWFPAHQTLGRAWETEAERLMAQIGFPTLQVWYNETTKLSLIGRRSEIRPGLQVNFANALLADIDLPVETDVQTGRGIIPIEVNWTKLEKLDQPYLVTLKLVDATGQIWATRDSHPLAGQASFETMAVGQSLSDRHGLLIAGGTPPGSFSLRLSVTGEVDQRPLDLVDQAGQPQGVEATLGQITVVEPETPISAAGLAMQTKADISFERRIKLVGYTIESQAAQSGDTVPISLFWRSLDNDLPDLTMFVQLQDQTGQAFALTERPPVYPTTAWSEKTVLRDLHKLSLPATIPAGSYSLAAGVLLPDKTRLQAELGDQVILGQFEVEVRPHNFEPPHPQVNQAADFSGSARLIGYDLANIESLQPGQALTLTLYWQSQAGFDRGWTVFAHLIDEQGYIQGQQDQLPGGGDFPTTSWVPGEYIIDSRQIKLNEQAPAGTYFIRVGFYDANSVNFERLPVTGPGIIEPDAVVLTMPIEVPGE